MTSFKSDIVLGDKYEDKQTGITGTAVSVHFYQFACERVALEVVNNGKIQEYFFDAPRLTHTVTGKAAEVTKTGGPQRSVPSGRGING